MTSIEPLREFVTLFTGLFDERSTPVEIQKTGAKLLKTLVSRDDWLPEPYTRPHPERYSQYLLHCDPLERFSVVSFVWGPGQKTPLHDHRVWGLIGMLRGRESETQFTRREDGTFAKGETGYLEPGEVSFLLPGVNDYHLVANALADRTSISIHVYGANIGGVSRAVYEEGSGVEKTFISGYSSEDVPNLWDRSRSKAA
ncbi:cysteine dioxygenase family protein [Gluconobacter albidus]|uniref:3-mercaptopropionate dioxygenase n=1 Tax=Gluconobacter albidus TaxID=318683 RepID=A0AAW3R0A1_9PROT|nr:cysteine dioxygenase [Gluconobacter albidus]KXV41232.1 cysteine dioxygenase [Gluconobacter albidus]MBS1029548.1 cysteine dioxygenase [Gluconobacter albidus]MCP1274647.1 cysteine dioxygenase [Gluconobacter albidus]GBQ88372.1 cysteine dioxygenase type I [Gluconobacter albidus NBRC 3250]GLQ69473.1 3-mercaptopropionate dioxygenase [Gluconobacter albidus]